MTDFVRCGVDDGGNDDIYKIELINGTFIQLFSHQERERAIELGELTSVVKDNTTLDR